MAAADAGNPATGDMTSADNLQVPATIGDGQTPAQSGDGKNLVVNRIRKLSRPRQIQLIMAVTATFSMIIALYLWSSEPNYQLLYGKLSQEAAGEIIAVLKQEGIDYSLDKTTGKLKVRSADLHSTRIMLAAQGLPKADGTGFEMLDKDQGFGSSQFMEKVRYHRAIEGELARSITGLDAVESARVHLAIPKQSVFVRDKREPSAAVMVNLKGGRTLEKGHVKSIVHMVASSIPEMLPDKVTVVDQTGALLSRKDLSSDMAMSTAQFDYRRKLEEYYVERIERILVPIIGFEGVRAQVDADVDFTMLEQTQESFNPDLPSLRSEHTISEESRGGDLGGVPGALTNQPPGVANAPQTLKEAGAQQTGPSRKSNQSTFNYELDKTISHTKRAPGQLRRLSVAVVIDDKSHYGNDRQLIRTPHSPEEIEQLTLLIKDTVGFSVSRGDSINVINATFKNSFDVPDLPLGPVWERQWFIDLVKQVVIVLLILLFLYIVMRPIIRELTVKEEVLEGLEFAGETVIGPDGIRIAKPVDGEPDEGEEGTDIDGVDSPKNGGLSQDQWDELGITHAEYEQMLSMIRGLAIKDPRVIAQVMKTWIVVDEEGL